MEIKINIPITHQEGTSYTCEYGECYKKSKYFMIISMPNKLGKHLYEVCSAKHIEKLLEDFVEIKEIREGK